MTDAEWADCDDPKALLGDLPSTLPRRKILLFAVACCRRLGTAVTGPELQRLLASAEAFADGDADEDHYAEELHLARVIHSIGNNALKGRNHRDRAPLAAIELLAAVGGQRIGLNPVGIRLSRTLEEVLLQLAHQGKQGNTLSAYGDARGREERYLAVVLRDVVGPRGGAADVPALARDDRTVVGLLAGVVADAAYDRLPILADALEDAGCADAELVRHLRGPEPHVRGCWAVDVLRGRG